MLHVVLGDGEMSRRELSSTLEDLLEKAGDEDFWFLVQAKAEPTATDKAMMEWITERGVYFETISDDHKSADGIYGNSQNKHTAKRLAPKVASLLEATEEDAALFALFVDNNDEVEADAWLMDVATSVADKGVKVFAMNDGLAELGFDEEGEEGEEGEAEEAAPEPPPAPTKKAAAKKAPAKAPPKDEDEPEAEAGEDIDIANDELTRDFLEGLTLPRIKEIAEARGIVLPPRTRATTYIAALLGEDEEEPQEAEVEEIGETAEVSGDAAIVGEAMLIVVYNGTVVSRALSVEQALELARM
jgi:hypothetical protein